MYCKARNGKESGAAGCCGELPAGGQCPWTLVPTRLDPVSAAKHAADLYASFYGRDSENTIWTYSYGPFARRKSSPNGVKAREGARARLTLSCAMTPPMALSKSATSGCRWSCSRPGNNRGHLPDDARHCFDDLGVRRLEWKCDFAEARARRRIALALPLKAFSASITSSRAATGTPPGSPC